MKFTMRFGGSLQMTAVYNMRPFWYEKDWLDWDKWHVWYNLSAFYSLLGPNLHRGTKWVIDQ